jgi:CRISPR system Cascade subunit CasA
MTSFDLTTSPWIRCAELDGRTTDCNLIGVFERAPTLRGLANESPLVNAAIRRLLLAILHRCFGPADDAAWQELWERRGFDMATLRSYFDEWQGRFDLLHPERPFFQVAELVDQTPNYSRGKKPAREIIAEQSSYGGPRDLFESRPISANSSISPATAARWLVSTQAFHPGGLLSRDVKNGDPTAAKSGPLCSAAVVAVRGESLFETLLLNLVNYPADFPSTSDDAPAWERDVAKKFTRRACRGLLDWYTWQSRRMQLLPGTDDNIEHFVLLPGTEATDERVDEPMCAYRKVEKLGFIPIGLSEERALWRDSTALYQIQREENLRAPLAVEQLARRGLPRQYRLQLQVEGQVPAKASIVLTRAETLPFPIEFVQRPDLVGVVKAEIARCEQVQSRLRVALRVAFESVLSTGDRKPDPKDVGKLVQSSQALPRYWAAVKPHFDELLRRLPGERAEAVLAFRVAVREAALRRYETTATASSTSSRALKGLVRGARSLQIGLAACGLSLSELEPTDEHKETVA